MEVEISVEPAEKLNDIINAGEDYDALVRIAEVSPDEFSNFLEEIGETEDEHAKRLLRAAKRRYIDNCVVEMNVENKERIQEPGVPAPHEKKAILRVLIELG